MTQKRKRGTNWSYYPDGFPLGQWIAEQRKMKRLTPERKERLEKLPGWTWNSFDSKWQSHFELLKKYGAVSRNFVTPCGTHLGNWISNQRKTCKDPERRKMLESIPGWAWNKADADWFVGFELTKKYGVVPVTFKTPCGYRLGNWQNNQRKSGNGCKDPERRKMLESIPGWSWNPLDDAWNAAFELTKKHGMVSTFFKTPCGFSLGQWQADQRNRHCKDQNRRKKLETIPGWYWGEKNQ